MKNSTQINELEAHNQELLNEWRINPKRKIYKWADSIPVRPKHHLDEDVLNLFGVLKFWEWGEWDVWVNGWIKEQSEWQRKDDTHNLLTMCEKWWKKYIHVISDGNKEIGIYLKALIGRSMFNPTVQSKVVVCFFLKTSV